MLRFNRVRRAGLTFQAKDTKASCHPSHANPRRPHPFHLVSPSKTKLQAAARGWLARRLARVILLRGGCRRELDAASGAWQYVWTYRAASDAPAPVPAGDDGGLRGNGGGEGLFRSWYPPTLLKNETLPSPRAALRRVEGEDKKREARLALANELLDSQKGRVVVSWAGGGADFSQKDGCCVLRSSLQ